MRRQAEIGERDRRHGAWERRLLGALGLAGLTTGALAAGSAYVLRELTAVPAVRAGIQMRFTPWELDLPFEEVAFLADDGATLRGWLIPRPGSRRVIVGLGGYRGQRADLLGMAAALWRAGYNVLLFDYRGHGDSDGRRVTLGFDETADFRAALRWLGRRLPDAWIGALGFSMGGVAAILGAAVEPAVRAIITDCAFCRQEEVIRLEWDRRLRIPSSPIVDVVGSLMPRLHGFSFRDVEPLAVVDRLAPRPLLLIHAAEDTIVPVDDARRLYTAAGGPKDLWVVPDAPHCGAYFLDRVAYARRVVDFFDQAAVADERLPVGYAPIVDAGLHETSQADG